MLEMYELKMTTEEFYDIMMDIIEECIDENDMIDVIKLGEDFPDITTLLFPRILDNLNISIKNKTMKNNYKFTGRITCKKKARYCKDKINSTVIYIELTGEIAERLGTNWCSEKCKIIEEDNNTFVDLTNIMELLNIITGEDTIKDTLLQSGIETFKSGNDGYMILIDDLITLYPLIYTLMDKFNKGFDSTSPHFKSNLKRETDSEKSEYKVSLPLDGKIAKVMSTNYYQVECPVYWYEDIEYIDFNPIANLLFKITEGDVINTMNKEKIFVYDYESTERSDGLVPIYNFREIKHGLFIRKSNIDLFITFLYKYIKKFNNK